MNTPPAWLLYGATGYTGRLIAKQALAHGARPVLAGRNPKKIQSLAAQLDCPWRAFSMDNVAGIAKHLQDVPAVLHCAGPFCDTARPMIEACLAARVHYLDITGEYDVIQWASQQDQRAKAAGVVVMPAVGMDVVPSDCLAALLGEALPGADHLELAIASDATISPGTARTVWRHLSDGARVRRGGQIVQVPAAADIREIDFPSGKRPAMTIPWGDIVSAYHTTGIENIQVRLALTRRQAAVVRRWRWLLPLAAVAPVRALGQWWIARNIAGPSESELQTGRTEFWGRVTDPQGRSAEATLTTPHGYRLTADAAVKIAERVAAGHVPPGFHTPAGALGGQFIRQLEETDLQWRPHLT